MNSKPIRIAIVNLDYAMGSAVTGLYDIFAVSNSLCGHRINTEIVSCSRRVRSYNPAVHFTTAPISEAERYHLVIIPPVLHAQTYQSPPPSLIAWLKSMHQKGAVLCSVCAGAYILARTGLLDHREATTHWSIESDFRRTFPDVRLNTNRILVDAGQTITAGGGSAYIDLGFYLLKKFVSDDAAYTCAKYLLVDTGRFSQEHYRNLSHCVVDNDAGIRDLLTWIKSEKSADLQVEEMARRLGVSERTLVRRFKKATGESPGTYVQKLKIEEAKTLLLTTGDSFEYITYAVGYKNASSFRKRFRQLTGLTPSEYRQKFSFH